MKTAFPILMCSCILCLTGCGSSSKEPEINREIEEDEWAEFFDVDNLIYNSNFEIDGCLEKEGKKIEAVYKISGDNSYISNIEKEEDVEIKNRDYYFHFEPPMHPDNPNRNVDTYSQKFEGETFLGYRKGMMSVTIDEKTGLGFSGCLLCPRYFYLAFKYQEFTLDEDDIYRSKQIYTQTEFKHKYEISNVTLMFNNAKPEKMEYDYKVDDVSYHGIFDFVHYDETTVELPTNIISNN